MMTSLLADSSAEGNLAAIRPGVKPGCWGRLHPV